MRLTHSNPLLWPDEVKRTKTKKVSKSKTSYLQALAALEKQIKLAGIVPICLSHNYKFMQGMVPEKTVSDNGFSLVYRDKHGRNAAFACDKYFKGSDNLNAIARTIEHYRKMKDIGTRSGLVTTSYQSTLKLS